MRNVSRDQIVANFEELVADNQIQTAVELLVAAEPDDQVTLIEQTSPSFLDSLFQALSEDERSEVMAQLSESSRESLTQALDVGGFVSGETDTAETINRYLTAKAAEDLASAALRPSTMPGRARSLGVTSPRRKDFTIINGRLSETAPGAGTITIFSDPTPQEQRALVEVFEIDEHTLASALDPDEISRLEFDEEAQETFVVWTRPRRGMSDVPELLGLASMGFFLESDYLTIVTEDEAPLLRVGDRADSLQSGAADYGLNRQ